MAQTDTKTPTLTLDGEGDGVAGVVTFVVGGPAGVGARAFPPKVLQDEALSADDHARSLVVHYHRALGRRRYI